MLPTPEFEYQAGAAEELADLFHPLGDATRPRIVLACLKAERQGKQVFYSAADAHISKLLANMFEHIAEPANGMDA